MFWALIHGFQDELALIRFRTICEPGYRVLGEENHVVYIATAFLFGRMDRSTAAGQGQLMEE